MTKLEREQKLFADFDEIISRYNSMVETAKRHLISSLKDSTPLPDQLKVALQQDKIDDPKKYVGIISSLTQAQTVIMNQMELVRDNLDKGDVQMAVYFVARSSLSIDKAMENAINHTYRESTILPPAPVYFADIERRAHGLLASQ